MVYQRFFYLATQFRNNTCINCPGGALYLKTHLGELNLITVENNTASDGGAFYFENPWKSVFLSSFAVGNVASQRGGGLFVTGGTAISINNVHIYLNTAGKGGGMYWSNCGNSSVVFESHAGEVNANVADSIGAGIYLESSNVAFTGTVVSNNTARGGPPAPDIDFYCDPNSVKNGACNYCAASSCMICRAGKGTCVEGTNTREKPYCYINAKTASCNWHHKSGLKAGWIVLIAGEVIFIIASIIILFVVQRKGMVTFVR